jgi:hypothetical protein
VSEENKTFPQPGHTSSWEYRSLYEHYCQLRTENAQLKEYIANHTIDEQIHLDRVNELKEKLEVAKMDIESALYSCRKIEFGSMFTPQSEAKILKEFLYDTLEKIK